MRKSWTAALTTGAFAVQLAWPGVALARTPAEPAGNPPLQARDGGSSRSLNAKEGAGGLKPCLLNCYLGPRTGTEYNEGRGVSTMEWLQLVLVGRVVLAAQAWKGQTMTEYAREEGLDTRPVPSPQGEVGKRGGFSSCLVATYFGPRVAFERNEGRRIRTKEILLLVPFVNVVSAALMGLEASNGKTMTQIARDEGLDG